MTDSVLDFTQKLELEFQDLPPGTLKPDSDFRKSFEWSSINALITMAFIETEYRVNIRIFELEGCTDIQSLYNLVNSKSPRRN
jgi:acyl carrier protein